MKFLSLVLTILAWIVVTGCGTTGGQDQQAQGASRAVSSAWNSVSTTEDTATLNGSRADKAEGGIEATITTTKQDGTVSTVTVKTTGPVRDLNVFTDKVDISSSATVSGTSGTQGQDKTDTARGGGDGNTLDIPLNK